MPDLDFKSTISHNAGTLLFNSEYYTQAVHCFYYSVIQLMKYKLAHCSIGSLDYAQQDLRIEVNKTSTHDWLLKEILAKLSRQSKDTFDNTFRILKSDRIKADYYTDAFSKEMSDKCFTNADRLISILKTIS